jgi:hypothetical protein
MNNSSIRPLKRELYKSTNMVIAMLLGSSCERKVDARRATAVARGRAFCQGRLGLLVGDSALKSGGGS